MGLHWAPLDLSARLLLDEFLVATMSTYPVLNDQPIDQWKVTELKDELRRRNLLIKGVKDDLVKRLFEDLQGDILGVGGEGTAGETFPDDDLKVDETPVSADASVCQALTEHNDEGPEVATQEGDLLVSVTESSRESVVATTDVSQQAVVNTAEASQITLVATAEVIDAPVVDVATTDEISVSDAMATEGDDLESAPSDGTIMKEVYPQAEGHSEVIEEKAPEEGTSKKITVDDLPPDVAGTDAKLDATSAKGPKMIEQEAVSSPLDAITSHADPCDADDVATASEQNAETLIRKINSGDNALMNGKEHGDSKLTNRECKSILSGPKDQVSEANPDIGSQIKCVC